MYSCSEGCVNPVLYYHPGHCLAKQYPRHQTLPYHRLPSPQCHLYPTPQGLHQLQPQSPWSLAVTNTSLSTSVITSEMVWHGMMCSEWCRVVMVHIPGSESSLHLSVRPTGWGNGILCQLSFKLSSRKLGQGRHISPLRCLHLHLAYVLR